MVVYMHTIAHKVRQKLVWQIAYPILLVFQNIQLSIDKSEILIRIGDDLVNYTSTQAFYNGDEWAACKAQVLQDRMKNGAVYCEHCGKIILKSFNPSERNNGGAMVFHHKKYLTQYNVNDASVSINPDNIAILHWACHNEVHNRTAAMLRAFEKKVYIIVGAPCSGKSTWARERMQAGDIICDIDDIWETVSGQPRYVKPNQLKPVVFQIRDTIKQAVATGAGTWRNAFIIEGGTLALEADRKREGDKYRAHNVELVLMDATEEECLRRLQENPNGRSVEEYARYIKEFYNKFA